MKLREMLRGNYRVLILVFLAFFLMVLVSYVSISTIMQRQLNKSAEQNLKIAEATIETILMEPEVTMVNSALSIRKMIGNGEGTDAIADFLVELTNWLLQHEDTISGFNGMYGYIYGEFLDGTHWVPPEGYVPEERPWYTAAIEANGEIATTTPYVDAQTRQVILTVAQSLYDSDGDFIGILALDMQIAKLVEYARGLRLSNNGYSIMIDNEMQVFAHPDDEVISENMLDHYPEFAEVVEHNQDHIHALSLKDEDGTEKKLFTVKLDNGWYVVLVTPVRDYYSDIWVVLLILSILGLFLMVLLDIFLLRLRRDKILSDQENMSKSSFLANMSHEIRTPMNAIIGMSEIALREPSITPVVTEHVAGIRQAGANLLSLINDILDFSKIEAGKLEINEAPYLFSSLLNDAISIVRTRISDKPILFVTNIDSNIPNRLIGDELRIRQIILNVLNNAIKYTEEGYVSLTIDCKINDDGVAIFSIDVADSGIGIRAGDLEKLFEDFSRIDSKRNKQVEGTGLGLAITNNLCRIMGGSISVSSEYGKGSLFTITLPQKIDVYEKFADVQEPEAKSVLVYEPREIYGNSITCTIDNLGVDCTLAISHSTFLEEISNRSFSHVFVSSFLYDSVKNILSRLTVDVQLVLLVEFGEVILQKDVRTIAMPVHAVSIANILNNLQEDSAYHEQGDHEFMFVAPTARVLIVDDIDTNLKVTAGLLSPYQMVIDFAKSGMEAIELAKKNTYDLVFMDHMMPGMDGVEATMHIRALDGGSAYFTSLPIVALTANAVTGMREMFLNNGFDDFLAKPIETSRLYATLERWIPREKQQLYVAAKHEEPKADMLIENLDTTLGISMTGGNVENYVQTLMIFAKDGNEKLTQIRNNLEAGDLLLFTTNVHALKSASASIGATKLSELSRQMEAAGGKEDMQAITEHLDQFFAELSAVLSGINQYLSNASARKPSTVQGQDNTKYLIEALQSLKEALKNIDIATSDNVLKTLKERSWAPEIQLELDEISQNVLLFEYDEAIRVIERIVAANA